MPSRRFRSEGPILYNRYQFGYCEWLETSEDEGLEKAYEGGFLPYSGSLDDPGNLFYMARSLRVDLGKFNLGKKRRYGHRQWESSHLRRELVSREQFLAEHGEEAIQLARIWMEQRFGKPYLSVDRLRYILQKPFLKDVLTWKSESLLRAFALIVREDRVAHYWYVFYANEPGAGTPPGQGYLVDFVHWAGEEKLRYAYLGTAYGRRSLYKSRGIQGVEFWDGNKWSSDKEDLLRREEADDQSK